MVADALLGLALVAFVWGAIALLGYLFRPGRHRH